ncbi:YhjD/YihY/BrkB family envelope integrity protein [Leptospira sp. GIMC2001]|uniref:YhjD/YihY/BrkB family envelope integrity protein n=1 Tax=Leptospira sp. GIMC2001 TaxID=1513297 RepID=UPI0023491AC3|nr:YhjD/YihY/BrkB family envelope integrity protein [Leptospira sp. GIMC2001]WCL50899.1 YihY/virulence factor BrkB family protein [Leptospira sp. GIMC2001]
MKEKLMKLWTNIWEKDPNNSKKSLGKSIIRLFFSATDRFTKDEDLIRAASISYAIIVSFIPTLIVGLLIAANFINIKDYEELAKEYIRKNGIPMDVSTYFNVIYELLNNTAALTGIGFLFVLFSTTSVLRNLEDAMNKIWHVKKKRPFIQKVAEFVMVVVFGPLLLAIGLSTGQSLLSEFSAPTLLNLRMDSEKEFIVGEKHVYLKKDKNNNWVYSNILDKIDYDFQKPPIVFDIDQNTVLNENQLQNILHKITKASKQDLRTSSFTDMSIVDKNLYIITDNGTMIYSRDNGKFWMARKFQRKQLNLVLKASFKRIKMFNDKDGVIIGKNGLILQTSDAGENWSPRLMKDLKEDLNDIAEIKPGEYLVVGENFTSLITKDFGKTWKLYEPLTKINTFEKESLNDIDIIGDSIFICGDAGAILTSKDLGRTWFKKNIGFKKIDFFGIHFKDEKNGIMVGDTGNIRYTFDGGVIWKKAVSPTKQDLFSVKYLEKEDRFLVLGENYHLLANTPTDLADFSIMMKSPFWRIGVTALGKFILPFFVLWLIFFFVYRIMPYTFVKFKAAMVGAFCTSLALVIFIIGFQFYVSFFSEGKFAIYGTLAAIPLTLLLIYVSTIIILYGCEVAYLVQHPDLMYLAYNKRSTEELEKRQIWYGIQIIHLIYQNFHDGNSPLQDKDIMEKCRLEENEYQRIMEIYQNNEIIIQSEDGLWAPAISTDNLNLDKIVNLLCPDGYDILDYDSSNKLAKNMKEIFDLYKATKKDIFEKRNLSEFITKKSE